MHPSRNPIACSQFCFPNGEAELRHAYRVFGEGCGEDLFTKRFSPETPVILISACLAGLRTRYNGESRPHPLLTKIAEARVLVPVCPEILGGLGIPRTACRFSGGDGVAVLQGKARVVDLNGIDRTSEFLRGAEECLAIAQLFSPELIIFKEGSPSCGLRRVDIEGEKVSGCGVVTALFKPTGIPIITEDDQLPF